MDSWQSLTLDTTNAFEPMEPVNGKWTLPPLSKTQLELCDHLYRLPPSGEPLPGEVLLLLDDCPYQPMIVAHWHSLLGHACSEQLRDARLQHYIKALMIAYPLYGRLGNTPIYLWFDIAAEIGIARLGARAERAGIQNPYDDLNTTLNRLYGPQGTVKERRLDESLCVTLAVIFYLLETLEHDAPDSVEAAGVRATLSQIYNICIDYAQNYEYHHQAITLCLWGVENDKQINPALLAPYMPEPEKHMGNSRFLKYRKARESAIATDQYTLAYQMVCQEETLAQGYRHRRFCLGNLPQKR